MGTWQRVGAGATAAALVFGLGFGLGRETVGRQDLEWRVGQGLVGEEVFTVEHDGWSYGASDAVPMWVDARGSWHDGGWPECLRRGTTTVRFAAGPTTYVEGVGQRPVVAVDCRG